jgi:hypothetical protein
MVGEITNPNAKMFYQNFEHHVTRCYRVIIVSWPLPKLCCPSSLHSLAEVELLHQSWTSRATHFRRMSETEWKEWLAKHFTTDVQQDEISHPDNGLPIGKFSSRISQQIDILATPQSRLLRSQTKTRLLKKTLHHH